MNKYNSPSNERDWSAYRRRPVSIVIHLDLRWLTINHESIQRIKFNSMLFFLTDGKQLPAESAVSICRNDVVMDELLDR